MQFRKRGIYSRSRHLAEFNDSFSEGFLEHTIEDRLRSASQISLLEIGCGEGRVLMELRKRFPNIELHGINKEPWTAIRGRESLRQTALFYKIFSPAEVSKVPLPYLHFYDAKSLHFENNTFDIVISQVAIHYIDRKDRLLEEVWRVLKLGGAAYLHIDTRPRKAPDFFKSDSPRFVIYRNNRLVQLKRFLAEISAKGFDIKCKDNRYDGKVRSTVTMRKNTTAALELGLVFDELSSFRLEKLDDGRGRTDFFFGYRSVFKAPELPG